MNSYQTLSLRFDGPVATLALARPKLGNALGSQAGRELRDALDEVRAKQGPRVLVIRGEGKAFCVGGDLSEFAAAEDLSPAIGAMVRDFHAACRALAELDMPVLAVVQGAVAGAGLVFVGLADHVIASSQASFSYAYPSVGFSGDGGVTWILPKLMGLRAFRNFVTARRPWTAEQALGSGLVSSLVDAEALDAEAAILANVLADGPTRAMGAIRRLAWEGYGHSYVAHLEREADEIVRLAGQEDPPAAIRAMMARETPQFSGR